MQYDKVGALLNDCKYSCFFRKGALTDAAKRFKNQRFEPISTILEREREFI